MSYHHKLQQLLSPDGIDVTLAKIGLITSVLLLGLRLLTAQVLLVVIPLATGFGCLLYLGVRSKRDLGFSYPSLPQYVLGYLPAVVFGWLAVLVGLVFAVGGRTAPIYLLTGAIGATILAQALLVEEDGVATGLVLAQIVVAAVVIRMTALFVTPGFIGVDIWTHVPVFVGGIVQAESLAAIADSKYSMAPLYHSLGAVGALVFGSPRTGVYLSVGLLVPLSGLFVYGSADLLVPTRWALVATALYAFADQFIRWGLHVIPTSLGLVFFLGALYCVTKLFYTDELWVIALLLACSLGTVFTHQVSTAVVLVLLGMASVSVLIVRFLGGSTHGTTGRNDVGIVGAFLTTLVVTIVAWLNTPWYGEDPFLVQILATLVEVLTTDAGFLNLAGGGADGTGAVSSGVVAQVVPYIEWFGFGLLLLAAVVGGLAMLSMENPPGATFTYILTAVVMFLVVFGFSLFGVRTIMPGRWMGFMYAIFAVVGAAGLYHLAQNASRQVLLVVFLLLTLGYPTTMVVGEKATLDDPAFDDVQTRYSFTETELAAVDTIASIYPPSAENELATDHPYTEVFERLHGFESEEAAVGDAGVVSSSPVVFREYQVKGPAIFQTAGETPTQVDSRTVPADEICPSERNHVYANGDVMLCTMAAAQSGDAA